MKRLRMLYSSSVDGMLFIQFIDLILISAIRKQRCVKVVLLSASPFVNYYGIWKL